MTPKWISTQSDSYPCDTWVMWLWLQGSGEGHCFFSLGGQITGTSQTWHIKEAVTLWIQWHMLLQGHLFYTYSLFWYFVKRIWSLWPKERKAMIQEYLGCFLCSPWLSASCYLGLFVKFSVQITLSQDSLIYKLIVSPWHTMQPAFLCEATTFKLPWHGATQRLRTGKLPSSAVWHGPR